MTNESSDGGILSATKRGSTLEFSTDPDPGTERYLVVDAPGGMLVLVPSDRPVVDALTPSTDQTHDIDRNAQLRSAFAALGSRVSATVWSRSAEPETTLVEGFNELAGQQVVRDDVRAYVEANPSVLGAAEMLFTSIAMSARADWRAAPAEFRGVAARGWFLGRWIPTFLVLDGPILRFLNSSAFRRQVGCTDFLRAVRIFFHARDFMALRHGFAHWSFSWTTNADDSEIVVHAHESKNEVRVSRREVDAFHILTFAVVQAINQCLLRDR
jgi:hypothetical protein